MHYVNNNNVHITHSGRIFNSFFSLPLFFSLYPSISLSMSPLLIKYTERICSNNNKIQPYARKHIDKIWTNKCCRFHHSTKRQNVNAFRFHYSKGFLIANISFRAAKYYNLATKSFDDFQWIEQFECSFLPSKLIDLLISSDLFQRTGYVSESIIESFDCTGTMNVSISNS